MKKMTQLLAQARPFGEHPLDIVEQLLGHHDIAYERQDEDELFGEMDGHWCRYRLWYRWEETLGVLVFACMMDAKVPSSARQRLYPLLAMMNEKLWLGHFELDEKEGGVTFRYSLLAQDSRDIAFEQFDTLLEIAATECDRFYPAFQGVLWGNKPVKEAVELAIFDTAGEA